MDAAHNDRDLYELRNPQAPLFVCEDMFTPEAKSVHPIGMWDLISRGVARFPRNHGWFTAIVGAYNTGVLRVGTLNARHPMPVDCYLVEGFVDHDQAAYDTTYDAASAFAPLIKNAKKNGIRVELYYTGLTQATIACMDAFTAARIDYAIMAYSAATETYYQLKRK